MKKIIKDLYTIIWALVMAVGLLVFIEVFWLVVNWNA